MKCKQCGFELENHVLFCKNCGAKVERQFRYCRECGSELSSNINFCPNCGAKVQYRTSEEKENNSFAPASYSKTNRRLNKYDIGSSHKKRISVDPVVFVLFILALTVALVFAIKNKKDSVTAAVTASVPLNTIQESEHSISKGTEYSFMSDEWNVYIAVAVSDTMIKVENWDKPIAFSKNFRKGKDIRSYQINDDSVEFGWFDDEHTAFTIIFSDKNNSKVKKPLHRFFTINTNNSNSNKGTNYDNRIACYTYMNDEWHMYRAIPLSDNLIKIECWRKNVSFGKYSYGWDWCLIDVTNNTTDFHWTDEEHTSFTMTSHDPQNSSYWKNDSFAVFDIENPNYKYSNVYNFLNGMER